MRPVVEAAGDEAPKIQIKMKIKHLACIAILSLASLSGLKAQTTLASWNFNQFSVGPNSSPAPTVGIGSASAVNTYNSISSPNVESLPGSSSGRLNAWQILGASSSWSTAAPIGSQGAQFKASTFGYYRVMLSFDINATSDAPANMQVQYTTDGTFWWNATNVTVGGSAVVVTNLTTANGTNATEVGTYVTLASGWNNQITVDLSGLSGVDNNANFAVRIVNASTGTNNVDTTGAVYNNTSGNWAFNNVSIQGVSIDTLVDWTFASYGTGGINLRAKANMLKIQFRKSILQPSARPAPLALVLIPALTLAAATPSAPMRRT